MIPIPNDEMLMAYADGELEADVAAAVERAMVRDPMITIKAVEFLRSRRLARQRFSAEALPVPSEQLLRSAMGGQEKEVGARWFARPSVRLVAACLMLTAAGMLGWALNGLQPGQGGLAALDRPQMSGALNRLATGETIDFTGGHVRAIATMELPDAGLCRQLELVDRQSGVTSAIVCRHKGESWKTILAMRRSAKSDQYQPASGNELIDKFLDDQKAGPALDAEAEKRALEHS